MTFHKPSRKATAKGTSNPPSGSSTSDDRRLSPRSLAIVSTFVSRVRACERIPGFL